MKKLIFILASTLLIIGFLGVAKAEVYGYVLTIQANKEQTKITNNETILTDEAAAKQLSLLVKVVNPDLIVLPNVTKWTFIINSLDEDSKSLGSTTFEFDKEGKITSDDTSENWDIYASEVVTNNKEKSVSLKLSTNLLNRKVKSVEFTAVALLGLRKTNEASTKINLKENINLPVTTTVPVAPIVTEKNIFSRMIEYFGENAQRPFLIGVPLIAVIFLIWLMVTSLRSKQKWGRVLENKSNKPLEKVRLDLLTINPTAGASSQVISSVLTDANGTYSFKAMPGQYLIRPNHEGYGQVQDQGAYQNGQVISVKIGSTPSVPDIILDKTN